MGFLLSNNAGVLEQFQLLPWCVRLMRFSAIKELNVVELLICYTQNTNLAILGERVFHPFNMYFRILHASTMPQVDGELKHGEPISLQKVAKVSTYAFLSFFVSVGRSKNTNIHITRYSLSRLRLDISKLHFRITHTA